uniref:Uncharacterized protein n=1 Tax=Arundo donax TaxID=35708 RepID=A0A0A9RST6_ARUDO
MYRLVYIVFQVQPKFFSSTNFCRQVPFRLYTVHTALGLLFRAVGY